MFDAKIKSAILKDIVEAASLLVEEGKFTITPEEIRLKAVDPAHIAMIELQLSVQAFEEYKATPMELGIDIDKLKKVIRLALPEDDIVLKWDEEANRLNISFTNLSHQMGLLDPSSMREPKTPSVNLPAKITLKASDFDRGVKAAGIISDYLVLTADPEAFELSCKGDTDTTNLHLPKDSLIAYQCEQKVRSLFSLDYLSNLMKIVKPTDAISLSIGNDLPVKIDFEIAEGKGKVNYLLAPRIEPE
jgi:proliferating cell nuclear antigen